jgi:hypothetical protein
MIPTAALPYYTGKKSAKRIAVEGIIPSGKWRGNKPSRRALRIETKNDDPE